MLIYPMLRISILEILTMNRYVGANVAVTGPFFEKDFNQTNLNGNQPSEGWPLRNPRQTFSTISGFYDCQDSTLETNFEELRGRGCESVIAGTPHPLGLLLRAGNQVLNSDINWNTISNFQQTMRFRDGIEEWKYTWSPQNTDVQFDVEYKTFMHRTRPNVAATEMCVTPRGGNFNASIIDLLDGRSAVRSSLVRKEMPSNSTSIYVANHPNGVPGIQAWIFSNTNVSNGYADESSRRRATDLEATSDMSISQEWDVELVDGETAVFHKYVGLASSDKFSDPESTACYESARASEDGWDAIKLEHVQEWNRLMCDDCVTSLPDPVTDHLSENYIVEHLQIAWITSHYYMLQNLLPESGNNLNDDSISVGGLVSDTYAGFKFWDAETWMFPALAATNPEMAKQILKYRVKLLPQARANAQEDYVRMRYKFDDESALFPWTSGRYGNATGTGPVIDYEYHLNADIALMAFHYLRITGDEKFFQEEIWPVVNGIGHSIAMLLVKQGERYSLKNMTDPDEYAVGIIYLSFIEF
jgi:trehalose/maltose hydrolase-like predicted phosphorylase